MDQIWAKEKRQDSRPLWPFWPLDSCRTFVSIGSHLPKKPERTPSKWCLEGKILDVFHDVFHSSRNVAPMGSEFFFWGDTQQNIAFTYKLKSTKSLTSNDKG